MLVRQSPLAHVNSKIQNKSHPLNEQIERFCLSVKLGTFMKFSSVIGK